MVASPKMKARALCLALLAVALFVSPASAMRGGDDGPALDSFLQLQRRIYPGAVVSGRFYDWRAVSRYRAQAGLHFGYDIAMPAGTRVVTAWPGQVTAVAPWYGEEHGITMVSPSGYAVTFGHLRPRVRTGDVLNPGDVVGDVVEDHVDIKMRGPNGAYFDFGHDSPLAGGFPASGNPFTPVYTAQERLLALHGTDWVRSQLTIERRALASARASARGALAQFEDGVLSRTEVAEVERGALAVERRVQWLQRVEKRLRDDPRLQAARKALVGATSADAHAVRRAIEALVLPPLSPAAQRDDVSALREAGALSQEELEKTP